MVRKVERSKEGEAEDMQRDRGEMQSLQDHSLTSHSLNLMTKGSNGGVICIGTYTYAAFGLERQ